MAVKRMDNVGMVFEDLPRAITFFTELGLELEGKQTVEGEWVDRVVGLHQTKCDIAMMRVPNGNGRLELMQFQRPTAIPTSPKPMAANGLGMGRVMFAVDDLHDTVARLKPLGGTLIGEVVDYEGVYRLCYLRGPEGIIVALAQELGK